MLKRKQVLKTKSIVLSLVPEETFLRVLNEQHEIAENLFEDGKLNV